MSPARLKAFVPSLLLLAAAACQEIPVAPASLSSTDVAPLLAAGGNSAAAHACQGGGYLALFRADGSTFRNAGECVSYAARGGTLVHQVTATFTNVVYSACNTLSWGYEIDGASTVVATASPGCSMIAGGGASVTYLSNQTLRVFMRDESCGHTYFEDGDHGAVTGTDPELIRIADSGGNCERGPGWVWTPEGDALGNFNVNRSIE